MADRHADVLEWLREACSRYELDVVALYRREDEHGWLLTASDGVDRERQLQAGGHLLPRECGARPNIREVSSSRARPSAAASTR